MAGDGEYRTAVGRVVTCPFEREYLRAEAACKSDIERERARTVVALRRLRQMRDDAVSRVWGEWEKAYDEERLTHVGNVERIEQLHEPRIQTASDAWDTAVESGEAE